MGQFQRANTSAVQGGDASRCAYGPSHEGYVTDGRYANGCTGHAYGGCSAVRPLLAAIYLWRSVLFFTYLPALNLQAVRASRRREEASTMTREDRSSGRKRAKALPASYEAMLRETRDLSQRLLERMEELHRQFPSPELDDAIRRMREMHRDLPPRS